MCCVVLCCVGVFLCVIRTKILCLGQRENERSRKETYADSSFGCVLFYSSLKKTGSAIFEVKAKKGTEPNYLHLHQKRKGLNNLRFWRFTNNNNGVVMYVYVTLFFCL